MLPRGADCNGPDRPGLGTQHGSGSSTSRRRGRGPRGRHEGRQVWHVGAQPRGPDDGPRRFDDHRASDDGYALPHRRDRRDLYVHTPADARRAGAHQPGRQDLALVPAPAGRRSSNGANAGSQHRRLHRLRDGGRLPEAGTGRAVSHLYRRGVDQLLGPRRQDELSRPAQVSNTPTPTTSSWARSFSALPSNR